MTAITKSGVELGHLPILDIVRIASGADHVRYGLGGWHQDLLDAVGANKGGEAFWSHDVASHFMLTGMKDFPDQFHALRAGEALGAAVEAGVIEPAGKDKWRWVAS